MTKERVEKTANSICKIFYVGIYFFLSGCSVTENSKPILKNLKIEQAAIGCIEAINSDVLRDCIVQAEIQLKKKPRKTLQLLDGLYEKESGFSIPNIYNLSDIEYIKGLAYSHLNDHEISLKHYEKALTLLASANIESYTPNKERAYIQYEIGFSSSNLGKEEHAIEAFEKAIELHNRADEIDETAIGLSYRLLAQSLQRIGNMENAHEAFRKAILILKMQSTETTVEVINELGSSLVKNLQLNLALKRFNEAVDLNVQSENYVPENLAYSHYGLGLTYANLGDIDTAEHHFSKSLQIIRTHKLENSRLYSNLLNDWAATLIGTNRNNEVLDQLKRAHEYNRSNADSENAANNAYIKGLLLAENGNYTLAADWYEKALSYSENLNSDLTAYVFNAYAATMEAQQLFSEANVFYHRAFQLFHATHGTRTLHTVPTYYGLALLWQTQNNNTLATAYATKAVNIIQEARSNLHELDSQHQDIFRDSYADIFQLLIDLLLIQDRIGDAERVMEMLKDTEQTLSITRSAVLTGSRFPEDPQAIKTAEQISTYFADARRYNELDTKDRRPNEELSDDERMEYDALKSLHRGKDVAAQFAAVQAIAAELNVRFDTELVRNTAKESATAKRLRRIRDTQGENAAVLYLVANEERFIHLLITPDGPVVQRTTLDPKVLNEHIVGLRQALRPDLLAVNTLEGAQAKQAFWKANRAQLLEHSQWLYQRLIKPVEKAIADSGAQTLLLFVDGPLRYIPMAALHDGQQYLIERYALPQLVGPIAQALEKVDSVFALPSAAFGTDQNNKVITPRGLTFEPLKSVKTELDMVSGDTGQSYFNEHFTVENFLRESETGDHSVLHIATHYAQRPGPLNNSFWIFGAPNDKPDIGAEDLLNQWEPIDVDMLTLSACSTALPSVIDRGDSQDPNRRGFLQKETIDARATGVESESFAGIALSPRKLDDNGKNIGGKNINTVVATIWDVSDASTLLFMQRFYHHLDNPEFGRAEALRQAQLDLLNHRVLSDKEQQGLFAKLFTADQNSSASEDFTADHFELNEQQFGISDYSHPYFWAPFIMMGKWR